jgi:hypothetical protein
MQVDVILRDRKIFFDYDLKSRKIKHLTTIYFKDIKKSNKT